MEGPEITDGMATEPCPYTDGQLLKIVRGGFAGKILKVNGRHTFWGDHARWEIVLDVEHEGQWLYFVRESAEEVARLTEPM